jgi:general secretion pathway protein B
MESYKPPINRPPSSKPANAGQQPVTAPRQSTSTNASNTKPVEIVKPRPKPEKQELTPIGYWELPDAVRANVPETKFSVLVYADNPADRFVLINGQRLVEGDEAGSGLVVKEIRRDGVIFSYRLYQFLVDR